MTENQRQVDDADRHPQMNRSATFVIIGADLKPGLGGPLRAEKFFHSPPQFWHFGGTPNVLYFCK
jgi:hypothetical protein